MISIKIHKSYDTTVGGKLWIVLKNFEIFKELVSFIENYSAYTLCIVFYLEEISNNFEVK